MKKQFNLRKYRKTLAKLKKRTGFRFTKMMVKVVNLKKNRSETFLIKKMSGKPLN